MAAVLSIAGGCAVAPDENLDLGETEQEVTSDNGISLNGISLNGISLNGISLNGISLNGISLNGISLNGTSLDAATIVGSSWTGELSGGTTLELRVDAMTQVGDVGMYDFSYSTSSGWRPLCGIDGDGMPIRALAVPGVWDLRNGVPGGGAYTASSTQFTIACRGKSIAKCVEMGYKPWSHAPHMQACVRLLRADYCGDGAPHTRDGQTVDIYDQLGIQELANPAWEIEGEWDTAGARCISQTGGQRFAHLGLSTPSCIASGAVPTTPTCGTSFSGGALLVDRLPPPAE
ncbi:MAG: hypothetical protein KIT31_35450 [Deltaproteobacteria bacterium]|nr:hypothetical protein [Deltaproteobacteria bacterium]